MTTRNSEKLESFVAYCQSNPNQRFWQALRNWTREEENPDVNFIFWAPDTMIDILLDNPGRELTDKDGIDMLVDTFYIE